MNVALFEDALQKSGLKTKYLSDRLGISPQAFNKKRKGLTQFTFKEVKSLMEPMNWSIQDVKKIFLD